MPRHPTLLEKQRAHDRLTPVSYDPEPGRDAVRAILAFGLAATFVGITGYILYSTHGNYDKAMLLFDKLLPLLSGLLGSAVGFYFGSLKQSKTE